MIRWNPLEPTAEPSSEAMPLDLPRSRIDATPVEDRWDLIQRRLEPLRRSLLEHRLYGSIRSLAGVRTFMEHHVFAVWDFMSLLRALQRSICCVDVPWIPPADPASARLLNEINLGEETDEDGHGGYASHFDLYRAAMIDAGADVRGIDRLVDALRRRATWSEALDEAHAPPAVRRFVGHTFGVIASGDVPAIASAFTFGREDLLPGLFQRIVDEINDESSGALDRFKYYLDRHIALDGDDHGPKARRLVSGLCLDSDTRWRSVEQAAVAALQARIDLWDAMAEAVG